MIWKQDYIDKIKNELRTKLQTMTYVLRREVLEADQPKLNDLLTEGCYFTGSWIFKAYCSHLDDTVLSLGLSDLDIIFASDEHAMTFETLKKNYFEKSKNITIVKTNNYGCKLDLSPHIESKVDFISSDVLREMHLTLTLPVAPQTKVELHDFHHNCVYFIPKTNQLMMGPKAQKAFKDRVLWINEYALYRYVKENNEDQLLMRLHRYADRYDDFYKSGYFLSVESKTKKLRTLIGDAIENPVHIGAFASKIEELLTKSNDD